MKQRDRLREEITDLVLSMPPDIQERALSYIRTLHFEPEPPKPAVRPLDSRQELNQPPS
jgi:hypothetical protein